MVMRARVARDSSDSEKRITSKPVPESRSCSSSQEESRMRKWLASIAVLGSAAAGATAQTVPVPPIGGYGQSQMLFFDDGVYEIGWRISFFAAPGDAYAVDFDDLCGGM